MIVSFKNRGLKKFFEKGDASKLIQIDVERIRNILMLLHTAQSLQDVRSVPKLNLHSLQGDRKGYWAVTVRANWRIVFQNKDNEFSVVDYTDYHGK